MIQLTAQQTIKLTQATVNKQTQTTRTTTEQTTTKAITTSTTKPTTTELFLPQTSTSIDFMPTTTTTKEKLTTLNPLHPVYCNNDALKESIVEVGTFNFLERFLT